MELTAAIAVIAALLTNIITAVWAQHSWTDTRKRVVSGGTAIVLGVIVAIATGQIVEVPDEMVARLGRLLIICAIVITLAQGFYRQFKGTLSRLEEKTSLEPGSRPDGPA